ncbi:MAG: hypothetical protein J3Q66DRAFT_434613 [Benniella sp.]|nr:MAG: hypothetical protein J3Q66DRAFT_434613 [Benniella sp.]
MSSPPMNPLELPELLRRISRYVTMNDAVACAQVCRPWSEHFASAIWHTIDFAVHNNLHQMDTKVLARYGHHIRVATNMKDRNHIMVLIVSDASKLRQLSITMTATPEFYANFSDLLRQTNTSLERVEIVQPSGGTTQFLTVDSLCPAASIGATSKLSILKLQGLTMTRNSFSSLLRSCPTLTQLEIRSSAILSWPTYDKSGAQCYRHTGITFLTAPVEQVFKMDSQSENAPSLFVHLPNLKTWKTWASSESITVSAQDLRKEVGRCCSMLTALWTSTPAPTTISMLTETFDDLTAICILNKQLSAEMAMAILNHRETLIQIMTFIPYDNFYESEVIPEVERNKLDTGGWIIQSLPRHCDHLQSLKLPVFEMNMDDMEKAKWGCHGLEGLHIRIQDLNTKEKIDRAIRLWKEGRIAIKKNQSNGGLESAYSDLRLTNAISPSDNSIEARVARHLLKFKKLRDVWLGWKTWKVAQ